MTKSLGPISQILIFQLTSQISSYKLSRWNESSAEMKLLIPLLLSQQHSLIVAMGANGPNVHCRQRGNSRDVSEIRLSNLRRLDNAWCWIWGISLHDRTWYAVWSCLFGLDAKWHQFSIQQSSGPMFHIHGHSHKGTSFTPRATGSYTMYKPSKQSISTYFMHTWHY